MSRNRREVQQQLPFTAAFALIQALRDPSGVLVREKDGHSHESFRPDFMNALSSEPLSEEKERGSHFGYAE